MENPELLLLEIEEFNRTSNSFDDHIPPNLENFIEFVSKTGKHIFPWKVVKKLFQNKINNVMNNLQSSMSTSDLNVSTSSNYMLNQSSDSNNTTIIKERIVERMKSFTSAPFTIQRMCELLIKPNSHYNRIDKFLRGLEKCIMVVTTVDPNGNKIFMENFLTNGVSLANHSLPLNTPIRPITPINKMLTLEETNSSLVLDTETTYELPSPSKLETEYNTESVRLSQENTVTKVESEEISNGDSTETYNSDVTEAHFKCVSIETSSATVDGIKVNVTETITSDTEMVVSNGETIIKDTDSEMSSPVKTTEIVITTYTSQTEPIIDATKTE